MSPEGYVQSFYNKNYDSIYQLHNILLWLSKSKSLLGLVHSKVGENIILVSFQDSKM